ncbi:hypothetical protein [Limoniibacter endophyticus]|uniref:Uncharacterized protein n=1 Tax=Limoniibacter endophyticus TaxID=1565040 RepID=A0A8J3DKY6_9HYPH|nr:hypothetical protein [Limoniibacter endophyticus]GHC78703.1 hypothetical protein GCM10010136_30660 [Limoniibacter endophyticus]
MQIHLRGIELVTELADAADHPDHFSEADMAKLLKEASEVIAVLLERDIVKLQASGDTRISG